MKILYLYPKFFYERKMSVGRRLYGEAVSRHRDVDHFKWWGEGWPGYDNSQSLDENLKRSGKTYDCLWLYKPERQIGVADCKIPKIVCFNECWPDDPGKALAEVRGVYVAKSATRKQLLEGLKTAKAERGTKPNSPMPPIPPHRRAFADIGPLVDIVTAGLKEVAAGGKWVAKHSSAAAQWLWQTFGGAISKLGALNALLNKFTEAVRRQFRLELTQSFQCFTGLLLLAALGEHECQLQPHNRESVIQIE